MLSVSIQRTHTDLPLPSYALPGSSGLDLLAGDSLTIAPGTWGCVTTGLRIALKEGYEGQIRPRSGLAAKHGITVLNSPGTIDADYRGELIVILINHGKEPFSVERGMRIAQLVITPVFFVQWHETEALPDSVRGDGKFGSTGLS